MTIIDVSYLTLQSKQKCVFDTPGKIEPTNLYHKHI